QLPVVEADAVPLDQREFRVVAAAALVGAEGAADLVDAAAAGGQQPFHGEFRRGLQPEPAGRRGTRPGIGQRQALEVRIAGGGADQHRRLHLQHLPLGKETADGREQRRPPSQVLQAGRRPPGCVHYSLTRETYSPVRVSTRITSPSGTNSGTRTTAPVSSLAGLPPPPLVSPRTPGSVSTILRLTKLG